MGLDSLAHLDHMSREGLIGDGVVLGWILVGKDRPRCKVARIDVS